MITAVSLPDFSTAGCPGLPLSLERAVVAVQFLRQNNGAARPARTHAGRLPRLSRGYEAAQPVMAAVRVKLDDSRQGLLLAFPEAGRPALADVLFRHFETPV